MYICERLWRRESKVKNERDRNRILLNPIFQGKWKNKRSPYKGTERDKPGKILEELLTKQREEDVWRRLIWSKMSNSLTRPHKMKTKLTSHATRRWMNSFGLVNMVFPQCFYKRPKAFQKQYFEFGKNPNSITLGTVF